MSEPRKPDRWNSLLETLGVPANEPVKAEVTPQPTSDAPEPISPPPARPQPISMLPPEKPKTASKPKPTPPPAKSPSYWSRIAGALGLEVSPELEVPAPIDSPPKIEASAPPPPRSAEPPRPFERSAHALEPSPREPAPAARNPLEEMFRAPPADVDVFRGGPRDEPPRLREPSAPRKREGDESGSVLDYDVEPGSDLSLGETAAREGGPRGEEGTERDPRRRRRRGRGRGRRGRGEERETLPPRREEEIEPAGEEVDLAYDRDEELDLELGRDQDDEIAPREERSARDERDLLPPGRRREEREDRGRGRHRRGRGGRDRDYSAGRPAGYESEEEVAPPLPERAAAPIRETRDERYDEEPDELELSGEHDEGDDEHEPGVPTHKKIPTWDEAVGILIDANMAGRAANPERDRGRGGRGRGRGRGR